MYQAMFSWPVWSLQSELALGVTRLALLMLALGLLLIGWGFIPQRTVLLRRQAMWRSALSWQLAVQLPLFVIALLKLVASSYSPFLYFQF